MTLTEISQKCVEHLQHTQHRSPATIYNYSRTYRQFVTYLREREFTDDPAHFTAETVEGFASDLGKRGCGANTVLNKLHAITALWKYGRGKKGGKGQLLFPARNPTTEFERPKEVRPETHFLDPDQYRDFMAVVVHVAEHLAREFLVDTGLRVSEVCEANVCDLVKVGDRWRLKLHVKGQRQRGAEPRRIPLSSGLATMLWESLMDRKISSPQDQPEAPLLLNRQGGRWTRSQLTQAMTRIGKRAGIGFNVSAHRLRHTANVIALQSEVDPYERAGLLNHRSLRTLQRYEHLLDQGLAKARDKVSKGRAAYLAMASEPETTCDLDLRLSTEFKGQATTQTT